ncbi:YihY/virulence factor BrkB family protein [Novosphingobium album (ex Liu et al. 2023)]|uniref:YihY/virulence factor BrkB family protein n=1 Tax=Novosphingobium album (ex Liu et al. 2023) TaxID=3031130 RepID=A0ABT5WNV1_9SPHN|nr:YihY/virulence factor BrkB family protein [Novosphingobium album (ex Liu et al. 2023)]MDE8651708.1 YihY/virulence factor BrkB family protein [Novosphingobium album (ex Liu et al. 2023)]
MQEQPLKDTPAPADLSPEARRRSALAWHGDWRDRVRRRAGPGTRAFAIVLRVANGAWRDGFIHAGNLAYMTLLALFPFFIAVAAIFSAIGEKGQLNASIDAVLTALPPRVAQVLGPVARDVASARQGWLLWIGGLFGLWTATSLIETIRDILHRAYGTPQTRAFWHYRLVSTGVIFASVLLLLISLSGQVVIAAAEEILVTLFPRLDPLFNELVLSRLIGALMLFVSIYLLFVSLTPSAYQRRLFPKWPGALLVTVWWVIVAFALPRVLRTFFTYDLTYGSLAGVMIALFFFWLVGLGMVVGAELNAALAVTPEERGLDRLSEADASEQLEWKREESE